MLIYEYELLIYVFMASCMLMYIETKFYVS